MIEKESSGMYFSGHMIDSYSENVSHISPQSITDILDTENIRERQAVKLCGIITSVTVKTTRKNEKMAFVKIEDRFGEIECLVFPNKYAQCHQYIRLDAPVYVEGTVSLREDEDPKILVNVVDELIENAKYKAVMSEQKKRQQNAAPTTKTVPPREVQSQKTSTPSNISRIYLRVPDFQCKQYLKAKNIVDIFDGNVKVVFYNSLTAKYTDYTQGLAVSAYVLSELEDILGKENVVPK
jgi:DNA polymerase-3 subunit alpha